MFEELIRFLRSGKTYSQSELADKLGVSPETLKGFMNYLSEKGMLSQVLLSPDQASCQGKTCCAGCKNCITKKAYGQLPVLWELNEKNERSESLDNIKVSLGLANETKMRDKS